MCKIRAFKKLLVKFYFLINIKYKSKQKNPRVSKILKMKKLFLRVSKLKNKATKDKLAKENNQKFNKLVEYEKKCEKT